MQPPALDPMLYRLAAEPEHEQLRVRYRPMLAFRERPRRFAGWVMT
jgi:hypothetical protein